MDRDEAARLLHREMTRYARRSRGELTRLVGGVEAYALEGPDGVSYQVEMDVRWDGAPGASIRVLGSIDDGSLRGGFRPVTEDFLVDADGVVDGIDEDDLG